MKGKMVNRIPPHRQKGQTLVVALTVLFLLLFLGGLFAGILRNALTQSERHSATLTAQYLAEAGIRYADNQLTHGPEGADWRPKPTNYSAREAAQQGLPLDPDFRWIRPWAPVETGEKVWRERNNGLAFVGETPPNDNYEDTGLREKGPSGGFTRFNQSGGRFLLRVNYNPSNWGGAPLAPDVPKTVVLRPNEEYGPTPLSRFIIIEAVGREGVLDPKDPTTFEFTQLRRELVALKPIGITDYIRFVTNKDHSSRVATLGASIFVLPELIGDRNRLFSSADTEVGTAEQGHLHNLNTFYGAIRVNGDLKWRGGPTVVLNEEVGITPQVPPNRGDAVEVAGRIFHEDAKTVVRVVQNLYLKGSQSQGGYQRLRFERIVRPSDSVQFTTVSGAYRDGLATNGADGFPRGIVRLEPPDIMAIDPGTRLARYRLLTRYSPPSRPDLGEEQADRASRNGYGAGIYIDNSQEKDPPKVEEDWLRPGSSRPGWIGHIYRPKGVQIVLMPGPVFIPNGSLLDGQVVNEPGKDGLILQRGAIRITRTDRPWETLDGQNTGLLTAFFQYPLLVGESPEVPGRVPTFENGVIFAEGNIRIRGKLPKDRVLQEGSLANLAQGQSLTIVSGGTIYIEGNLLKGDPARPDQPQRSGIALLAREHIAINATSYFLSLPETFSGDWNRVGGIGYTALYLPPLDRYGFFVSSARDPRTYPLDTLSVNLTEVIAPSLSSASASGASPAPPVAGENRAMGFLPPSGYNRSASDRRASGGGFRLLQALPRATPFRQELLVQHTAESEPGSRVLLLVNGFLHPLWNPKILRTVRNQWAYESVPLYPLDPLLNRWFTTPDFENWVEIRWNRDSAYWLSKIAVVPLDVRIEAVMYAQEKSFFIIPGEPFNNFPLDTRQYLERNKTRALPGVDPKSSYPFYNEPLDIKITINGAIAENYTASERAQDEWSYRWGWTPLKKPSGAPTAHGGDGLAFQYDPALRRSLRLDPYHRPLPLMPKLPVSPNLVFLGEAISG